VGFIGIDRSRSVNRVEKSSKQGFDRSKKLAHLKMKHERDEFFDQTEASTSPVLFDFVDEKVFALNE
jgi:hypothetical protein